MLDGWLKALTAAACLIVIAGGAVYLWGSFQAHSEAASAEAARQEQIYELYRLARAQPGEEKQVREYCRLTAMGARNIYEKDPDRPRMQQIATRCQILGFAD